MSSRIRCLPRNDTGSKIYAYLVPISSINLKSSLSESQGRIVAEGMCGNNHTVLLSFSLYLFSLFGMTSIFPSLSRCDVIFRSNALDSFVLGEGWWTTLKLFTLASKKQWSNGVKHQVVDMRRSRFPSLRSIFLDPLAANVDVLQLSWQRVRPWHEGARRPEFW